MVPRKGKAWPGGPNATQKPFGSARVDATPGFSTMLRVDPAENIIVGSESICRYIGVASPGTLWRWVETYGFPAIKRPDGLWMSSMTAIDQWIFLAAEVTNDNLEMSRGACVRVEKQIERLQRRLEAGTVCDEHQRVALKVAKGVGLERSSTPPCRFCGSPLGSTPNCPVCLEDSPTCDWCNGSGQIPGGERGEISEPCPKCMSESNAQT